MASVSSTSSGTTTDLAIAGLASGFDWQSLVTQLVQADRAPEQVLQTQQSTLQQQNQALSSIKTELGVLQNSVTTLKDPSLFDSRTATPSDSTLASATAAAGTALGTYSFSVTQLASAALLQGSPQAGGGLSPTDDVSTLALNTAPFATPVTAGTFTVNGKQISIAATDTLKSVFDQISSQTGGAVTAAYSAQNDQITLSSSSTIVLGSATDTSNFLQVAKLSNNGTGTVASSAKLGAVNMSGPLDQSNLVVPVNDGGAGAFTINGVTINFSATADSMTNVINRINDSGAGVVAGYDAVNNRFTLTNTSTGDVGISLQDVSGNFLAATGLLGGKLVRGNNLLYTVNSGPQLSSQTDTISADTSGLTGLSVTALNKGQFTVSVAADTATIKSAITGFVQEYNKVQSVINTQTASTTDASGNVTAGPLTGDSETEQLSAALRNLVNSTVSGLSGTLSRLDGLGFTSNGQDNSLSTTDLSGLDSALANNLSGLKALFTNSSSGLAVQFNTLLTSTIGDNGSLTAHQTTLTNESNDINTQVSNIEKQVLVYQQQLTDEFVAMETAQSQINQQLQYLQDTFGGSTTSTGTIG